MNHFRLRKLQNVDASNRASLDLDRLVAREERLLDTLSRGVDTVDIVDMDGDSDTTSGHSDTVPVPAGLEPVNANIEIDISSMESNSEV